MSGLQSVGRRCSGRDGLPGLDTGVRPWQLSNRAGTGHVLPKRHGHLNPPPGRQRRKDPLDLWFTPVVAPWLARPPRSRPWWPTGSPASAMLRQQGPRIMPECENVHVHVTLPYAFSQVAAMPTALRPLLDNLIFTTSPGHVVQSPAHLARYTAQHKLPWVQSRVCSVRIGFPRHCRRDFSDLSCVGIWAAERLAVHNRCLRPHSPAAAIAVHGPDKAKTSPPLCSQLVGPSWIIYISTVTSSPQPSALG
ncbi:uncharacterized protein F5Z01DRAFT_476225 [Emericellopsis atlantica]|uniref:Uncharacterized protein n=1 Tax=Emericellopsis atlantica TaxID=2614577 RepID=A0A9P7ZRI0_9HYPO|nr:uncharacterized protein F5Z01DRAFT_476225 [Emericellopsis atlantica]KAG9256507.1 hypothetical protein F5Z01DRAFT_476225 [Emericellopsis atlantica]